MDKTQKCLQLAEKIINSLNDSELVSRYLALKSKIFGTVAYEKKTEEITDIPSFSKDPMNEYVSLALHELSKKILPGSFLPVYSDSLKELESLKKVIDSKLESLNLVSNKLRTENSQLLMTLNEMSQVITDKMSKSIQKEEELIEKMQKREIEIEKKYTELENSIRPYRDQYKVASSENEEMRNRLKALNEEENNLDLIIAEQEKLKQSYSFKQTELKDKLLKATKKLESSSKDCPKSHNGSADIQELKKLQSQAELLRNQNSQMELQIRNSSTILGAPLFDLDSVNEDEIAQKILSSKLSRVRH